MAYSGYVHLNTSGYAETTELVGSVPTLLSRTTGINLKTIGTTDLYTVPTGKTLVITQVVIRLSAADTIAVVATGGIGTNGTQDDIIPAIALTGLTGLTKIFMMANNNLISTVAAGDAVVKLGIDVGATATTATGIVDLFGYLI